MFHRSKVTSNRTNPIAASSWRLPINIALATITLITITSTNLTGTSTNLSGTPFAARTNSTANTALGACTMARNANAESPLVIQEKLAEPPSFEATQWIWNSPEANKTANDRTVYFRLKFPSGNDVTRAMVVIHCDNHYRCWLNGTKVGEGHQWQTRDQYEITSLMAAENVIAVEAKNDGESPAGLSVAIVVGHQNSSQYYYSGQAAWKTSTSPEANWKEVTADDQKWKTASALGPLATTAPWAGQLNTDNVIQKPRPIAKRSPQSPFALLPSDRLTLLGGTFIERLQTDAYLEAQLYAAMSRPESKFQIRNLGWSGDDVWGTARAVFGSTADGMRRLLDDLARTEPTVVAICYGANESFAGSQGHASFRNGLIKLISEVTDNGATVVLITPPPFETLNSVLPDMKGANENLDDYCTIIKDVASELKLPLIDLHQQFRQAAKTIPSGESFTENNVHLNQTGYQLANAILLNGLLPLRKPIVPTSDLTQLIRTKNELYFHRYRPQNETYLFLFRKHEQGNNAVEIPQFDNLVNETEAKIRKACEEK